MIFFKLKKVYMQTLSQTGGLRWCANPEFELYKVFLLEDVSFDLNVIKNRRKTLNDIKMFKL